VTAPTPRRKATTTGASSVVPIARPEARATTSSDDRASDRNRKIDAMIVTSGRMR
jgi:hypothetical protein